MPADAASEDDPRRAKELFLAARELAGDDARRAYLDRECRDAPELQRLVEVLLAADARPASVLERPLAVELGETLTVAVGEPRAGGSAPAPAAPGRVGTVVAGRYKLLERIGEGGMGEVWVADQLAPIRRRVAIKLIKPGMDSRGVLARFEAERQALALMDHPNVARILDAGTAEDGRPYFVMELVKGVPITEFCDARRLTLRERLALFVPVCQAVQHAHQKGLIHRDLKPSNVLVALHDEVPVPKVIDFGIAKAIGQPLTESTLYTGFGSIVGTPAYMAPEQATFNQLDIDTRADVYALGVLLYELLAGSPPFELERLKRAALDEVLRLVREEEPPRPSARLSTSQARASLASVRRCDPKTVAREVGGELDWIVMKAIEKDRNRRYDTATGLAADVRRFLDGDAVQAHPPSVGYRIRKFARKHRPGVAAVAILALVIIKAGLISAWLAVRATRAEHVAALRAAEAASAAHRAEEARREAEHSAAGLRVDLGLAELQLSSDIRLGLLRFARDLLTIPADNRDLREFLTAALITRGQDYALLLPPISHNGSHFDHANFSPDRQTLLTCGRDDTARLWDVRTARSLAILRRGDEEIASASHSADGRTILTRDISNSTVTD
jgi:serine/threonine protein kinase